MDFFSSRKTERPETAPPPPPPREREELSKPATPKNTVPVQRPKYEVWFTKGVDYCYYKDAQNVCRDCKKKIMLLRLSPEERELLITPPMGVEQVIDLMHRIMDDKERSKGRNPARPMKPREFSVKYQDAMELICGITSLFLPIHKEFQFVVGMFLVIFKSTFSKRDREDNVLDQLDLLIPKLQSCKDYFIFQPNAACKKAAARLYIDLVDFAEMLLIHFRHTKSGKLIEALIHAVPDVFEDSIYNIDNSVQKLRDAIFSTTTKSPDSSSNNTRTVAEMLQAFERTTLSITASLETIDTRVTALETQQTTLNKFTMTQYAQSLKSAVMANPMDLFWPPEESLSRITAHGLRLSPQDHWESNGILDTLIDWRDTPHGPLLWLGGQSGPQMDPWITQLSVDAIAALEIVDLPCLYVMVADLAAFGLPVTATRVLRNLVCQALDKEPKIAFENPGFFTVERMQRAVTFSTLWPIFEKLVEGLAEDLFIIIDRVELVQPDEISTMNVDFLPELIELVGRLNVRVILTSMYEPPPEIMHFHQMKPPLLDVSYLDTGRPRLMIG